MSFGQCTICKDVLTEDMVATLCGHLFHGACLNTWFSQSEMCPNCRSSANKAMCIRLYPEISSDPAGPTPQRVVLTATKRQVLQLQRQCSSLTAHINTLGDHIGQFRQNIADTNQMLRDIHAIIDDIAQPEVPRRLEDILRGATEAERETVFSRADLSDLQTVVVYLENRITFYETLYGKRPDSHD